MDTSQLRICFMDVLRKMPGNGVNQFGGHLLMEIAHHAGLRKFMPPQGRGIENLDPADQNKVRELFWSFIIQGILMPGYDSNNPNLPFFALTEYGHDVLASHDPIPHDPDGYLKHLNDIAPNLDPVVTAYLKEGLDCFVRGNYTASVVMLGVANEKLIVNLAQALQEALSGKEAAEMQQAVKTLTISRLYVELKKHLSPLIPKLHQDLRDGLEGMLDGVFAIIRTHRNEAGHPTGQFFDRLTALGLFSSFPFYCQRVCRLIDFLRKASL